ncbi:hypothetical protein [uncultured Sphingomonas sp.]|uniref:hypothetical protein n=1 Tax=uncultured Sphingomonas sp. TaxID=158754 RepID=UPI0025EFB7CF|nr:hypothetical protein [uncultured Sphingomonas sp.]
MSVTKTQKYRVARNFNDATVERRFTKGEIVELTQGEADNFGAVGLVEPEADVDAAPAADAGETPPARQQKRG